MHGNVNLVFQSRGEAARAGQHILVQEILFHLEIAGEAVQFSGYCVFARPILRIWTNYPLSDSFRGG
jgi:hypothetical protein